MRKVLFTLGLISLLGGGLIGVCGWRGARVARDLLNNSLKIENWDLKIFKWCYNGLPFVDKLATLLDNKTYIVLLQNNRELRPSGGFMGSYAVVRSQESGVSSVEVQDIYVPDGQIVGHVNPPAPIQQAFGQGWWRLRDSNWDPDFTVAAPQIAWFFEQGGEKIDGLIAINLSFVNSLLRDLGEIKTTDYPETISAQTFYDLAQKYAEVGFFPGSTQKRDFLGAVGDALVKRIKQIGPIGQIRLINLIYRELKGGEILVWFADESLQGTVVQRNWDGSLGDPPAGGDYLYVVETNLGANKANCCVGREVIQTVDGLSTSLRIDYQNDHPFTDPRPPEFWGGNYINYLRVIIPQGSEVQKVRVAEKELAQLPLDFQYGLQADRYEVEDRGQFKIVGFWAVVPAQQSLTVQADYQLLTPDSSLILVKHQPGSGPLPYRLVYNGRIVVDEVIIQDKLYGW